jgi:hypothetical protein
MDTTFRVGQFISATCSSFAVHVCYVTWYYLQMFRVIQLFDAIKILVTSFGVTLDGCININRQMQRTTVCIKEMHKSTVSMKILLHYD